MLDLNEDDVPSSFGVGLRGMNERLRDLGGMIELKRGRDRKGAIVRAVVPGEKSEVQDRQSSSEKGDNSEKRDDAA
jgi:signal transduction histidine kinase